jgi:hypothetical protein
MISSGGNTEHINQQQVAHPNTDECRPIHLSTRHAPTHLWLGQPGCVAARLAPLHQALGSKQALDSVVAGRCNALWVVHGRLWGHLLLLCLPLTTTMLLLVSFLLPSTINLMFS